MFIVIVLRFNARMCYHQISSLLSPTTGQAYDRSFFKLLMLRSKKASAFWRNDLLVAASSAARSA